MTQTDVIIFISVAAVLFVAIVAMCWFITRH
jgi:hypothetical protein